VRAECVGVAGAGAWGTALACAFARRGLRVLLWGRCAGAVAEMRERRENRRRLPGISLPAAIEPTTDCARLEEASLLVLAVPAQKLAEVAGGLGGHRGPLVIAAKGIERVRRRRLSEVLRDLCPSAAIAVLSGPAFAAEVAQGLPSALTLAADPLSRARDIAAALASRTFRLYPSDDLVGVEIGGALKNVIAIAAGAVLGLGLGENARAALVTRGLAEMMRLAAALGARRETLTGLSGLGDLLLTATSLTSRNTRFGYELARGRPLAALTGPDAPLVEGVWTAQAALDLAARFGVEMPITRAVRDVVAGRRTIAEAVDLLLERPLAERE